MKQLGKFSTDDLQEILTCIASDPDVIIPPKPGFDAGVFSLDSERCIVIATDPCIGVPEKWFGWFMVHFACSDVALFGIPPRVCSVNILAPDGSSKDLFKRIMNQVCQATNDLGVTVITGHSGTYPGISDLTGTCTAMGIGLKSDLITPTNVRLGDKIFVTKSLGLEVLINYSFLKEKDAIKLFGNSKVRNFQNMVKAQSCVEDALTLNQLKVVSAMKDITEGGLNVALNEFADASNLGFRISLDDLPISEEFSILAREFGLSQNQILGTSSAGVIVGTITPSKEKEFLTGIEKYSIPAKIIGEICEPQTRVLLDSDMSESPLFQGNIDPYSLILNDGT